VTLSMSLSVWPPQSLLNLVPDLTTVQAVIWSVGGAWLLLRLLASNTTSSATALTTELRPAG
jgi:hypothetical protein